MRVMRPPKAELFFLCAGLVLLFILSRIKIYEYFENDIINILSTCNF